MSALDFSASRHGFSGLPLGLILSGWLLCFGLSSAQTSGGGYSEPIEISIEQAVMDGLSGNLELRIQQLNPVIAGAFEQIARGEFDPELFANFSQRKEKVTQVDRGTQEQFNVDGQDYVGSIGVRQSFATGTDVEAIVSQDRSISDRTPEQQSARLGLSVTQSLLRGFGTGVNLVSVRQARMETEASRYELRGFTESLVARIESTYWRFVLANKSIAIFEESLAIARTQRDAIEDRIEVGDLPRNEIAAVNAEIALRESALIDARSNKESLRLQLVRLINPKSNGHMESLIEPVTEPEANFESLDDLDQRLELVDSYRSDINEARLRIEQDRLETVQTRNGRLPRLDLFITLGLTGYADSFKSSFDDVDGDTYDIRAGFVFSQSLGRRVNRGRDLAALSNLRQSEEALNNLRQLARYDFLRAINEVKRAEQQIDATATVRVHQEQTVTNEQERFAVGASTALQVALAQRDLLESRIAEVESLVDYKIALLNLYVAEGSLLERRGIQVLDAGEVATPGYLEEGS
ncbi:MAG: TolC family protein [Verrucomicrobiae bacterium]|nr:TolC family protein [Verrucomicrobiae bacterium]